MYISLFLFGLAAFFNGAQKVIRQHWSQSIFAHFEEEELQEWFKSHWSRKFKDGDPEKGKLKHFGVIPFFPYLNDGWHFFQFMMIASLVGSLMFFESSHFKVYEILVAFPVVWNTFHKLAYEGVFIRSKHRKFFTSLGAFIWGIALVGVILYFVYTNIEMFRIG